MRMHEVVELSITQNDAEALNTIAGALGEERLAALIIDPTQWLTWHLDLGSVQILAMGLSLAMKSAEILPTVQLAGLKSLLEDCDEFITNHS